MEESIKHLYKEPTEENMQTVNGQWAVAHRVLKDYPEEPIKTPPINIRKAA